MLARRPFRAARQHVGVIISAPVFDVLAQIVNQRLGYGDVATLAALGQVDVSVVILGVAGAALYVDDSGIKVDI